MPDEVPAIPNQWIGEIGGPRRTPAEAEAAIRNGRCVGRAIKRVHPYETVLQGIWNWLKTTATGPATRARVIARLTAIG